jgi:hypothetical protein
MDPADSGSGTLLTAEFIYKFSRLPCCSLAVRACAARHRSWANRQVSAYPAIFAAICRYAGTCGTQG